MLSSPFCCYQLLHCIYVYSNTQSCLNYPFSTLKAGNTEQQSSPQPFNCNYNFTCSISAHAQTLNEYPDAKKYIRIPK